MQQTSYTMKRNPYQAYRRTQVETASKEQLLLMLYDGAIHYLKKAKIKMQEPPNEESLAEKTNLILKAQDIILELMAALDMEKGGDIARSLFQLYEYMNYSLNQANIRRDVPKLEEVITLLSDLRQTWDEAIQKAAREAAAASTAVPTTQSPVR
ncbi:MAG: flagellar export chaperone FliS [Candidatus Poribacteria bacterium]|nr:flagellar export chaperone FliS [Candidatus Poribacteria bacterium]